MLIATVINGQTADAVSVQDRGLQYGDGVFETIAVLEGSPLCWHSHLARLAEACQRLQIPFSNFDILQTEAFGLIKNQQRAVLKIIVTRGAGGRGYQISKDLSPTSILLLYSWPDYPATYRTEGVATRLCRTHYGANELLAGIKHLNRLEQILARNELSDSDFAEGIVMDRAGKIIEGTMSNIFIYTGGELLTPDLSQCGVCGIVRQYILEHEEIPGLSVTIQPVSLEQLLGADESFLCNSLIGIWPIKQINTRRFSDFRISHQIGSYLSKNNIIMPV